MKLTYRNATIDDVDELIHIYNAAFYDDYVKYGECPAYGRSYERMKTSIEMSPKTMICEDGQPVGVISLEEREEGIYYIGCLAIIPEYQHKGIGSAAMEYALEKHPNWKEVTLITPADKESNIRFYTKKCGFEIDGEEMDGNVKVAHFCKKR